MINNSLTSKSITVILFNANGLKNHINEIQAVLYEKRIDIALITKTRFTKYSNVFIPGYTLFKSNHPDNTAHGGVAIITNLLCHLRHYQTSHKIIFNLVLYLLS